MFPLLSRTITYDVMSIHSPLMYSSTWTGLPLLASPEADRGPAIPPIRRRQAMVRAAILPGIRQLRM
jgi:hypothetical protein